MGKNKQIHIRTQQLRSLVDEYGTDKVVEATGYTLSSLVQYQRAGGPVIPITKLSIAEKLLKATVTK